MQVNRHGLSRHIPSEIKRDIRQRSKFGCVVCRCGFYQYEHIDPSFENAREHNSEQICCLCGSCHDQVTRGRLSKELVKASYHKIQAQLPGQIKPPFGPLDFHDGSAELIIGGLHYSPAVQTVLRYHGRNMISVTPGKADEPGTISAVITDRNGLEVLRLENNEWVGSLESWDIEVVGQRLTIRQNQGEISLQLRLDPPGRIVVERLDMRFADGHVLATEQTYAIGRYLANGLVHWMHADIHIKRSSPLGAAIEFTDMESLESRDALLRGTGKELATEDRQIVVNSNMGVVIKPIGVVIASLCGAFELRDWAFGNRSLDQMRRVVLTHPSQVCRFIGTGQLA